MMGEKELEELEAEATVIQSNFRRWLLHRNYRNMRDATQRLQSMYKMKLARKNYETTRAATTTLQAARRGMLARRQFRFMRDAAASAMVMDQNSKRLETISEESRSTSVAGRNVNLDPSDSPSHELLLDTFAKKDLSADSLTYFLGEISSKCDSKLDSPPLPQLSDFGIVDVADVEAEGDELGDIGSDITL
jgi:hypothetical protein